MRTRKKTNTGHVGAVEACDTETTGLQLYTGDRMFAWSTCTAAGDCEVHRLDGSRVRQLRGRDRLQKMAASWRQGKAAPVFFNAKFDLAAIEHALDEQFAEEIAFHDTAVAHHLLRNDHPTRRLKDIAWELAGVKREDEKAVKRFCSEGGDYSMVPEHLMTEYQVRDAWRTMLLHRFLHPRVLEEGMGDIYEMELELERTTMRMQERGVMLRPSACHALVDELQEKVEDVLDEIAEHAGGQRVNPGSHPQLSSLLYGRLELPVLGYTKKEHKPSTDKETIEKLRAETHHPVLECILKWRSWSKGQTQIDKYLELADEDGVLHPDIVTIGPATGREACRRPNLQNVDREGNIRNPYPIPARKVFRPRPGYVNFHLDYSGIEFRVIAHLSGDEELLRLFFEGVDPHERAAEIFYGRRFHKASSKKRKTLRDAAKGANYGGAYGASDRKMCEILRLPESGLKRVQEWRSTFPGLARLSRRVTSEARRDGYVLTPFGRRLWINRDKPYIATNYVVQGTAAGILKRAKNRTHRILRDETGGETKLLLSVHDELVLEHLRKRLDEAPAVLRSVVESITHFPLFAVPLAVDVEVATHDWANKKPFSLDL